VKRDAPVVAVMRELSDQYPRYGYRRIQVFLARRGRDERGSHASAVAAAWPASTEKEAAAARGSSSSKAFVAHRSEPGLGIRLSVRRLCQWPTAEVPDGDR
jgi:hypothetical protein